MFNHKDGIMQALAKKKTQSKEDLFFAARLARWKLSKSDAYVATAMGMHLGLQHMLDPVRTLRSFGMWDKWMDIQPQNKTSSITRFQEPFLKDVENEYCAKHRRVPVNTYKSVPISYLGPSSTASRSG